MSHCINHLFGKGSIANISSGIFHFSFVFCLEADGCTPIPVSEFICEHGVRDAKNPLNLKMNQMFPLVDGLFRLIVIEQTDFNVISVHFVHLEQVVNEISILKELLTCVL